MRILLALVMVFASLRAGARTKDEPVRESTDWPTFEQAVAQVRAEDRTIGVSYMVSGALVTLGGIAGAQAAGDDTSKFVYALSQSLGIAGIGYGLTKLSFGGEYDSFYESLRAANLTKEQRDQLVRVFLAKEKERRDAVERVKVVTHIILGVANIYAASRATDPNARTFLQFFGGANFALAAAFTF